MKARGVELFLLLVAIAVAAVPVHALVSDKPANCVAMVEKADAFIHEKGKDYALKVFSVSKGPFIDKELYVFACSMDNVMLAHPYRPDLVGHPVGDFKDARGTTLFQEFQRIVKERGSGWVDYWWTKPGEHGQFPKRTYVKRIPEYGIYVGVGYYK
jgi:cytochrome c